MMKLLVPLVLLLAGLGAGAGAGLLLAPAAGPAAADAHADPAEDGSVEPEAEHAAPPAAEDHAEDHGEGATLTGFDYVRLNNQFVIPVVAGGEVASMVLLSLSIEVPSGQEEAILLVEPKLRDAFLQVLFDHANTGGFEGMFTAASAMRALRAALLAAARDEIGEVVSDVLIVELVRQDT